MSYNYSINGQLSVSAQGIKALRKSPEAVVELLEKRGYFAEVDYEQFPETVNIYYLGTISEHDAHAQMTKRLSQLSNLALGHLEGDYSIIDENGKQII